MRKWEGQMVTLVFGVTLGIVIGATGTWAGFMLSLRQPASIKSECAHDESNFRCVKFDYCYDGDTCHFNIPGVPKILNDASVRILGIDTAERKGKSPCEKEKAQMAKEFVERLLRTARRIDLVGVQPDKYFRIGANVLADNVSVGEQLIRSGLAYRYDGGRKQKVDWCQSSGVTSGSRSE